MNISEIKKLLEQVAANDLVEGADIFDHPCTVAIRALDRCVYDIEFLKKIINKDEKIKWRGSKRTQTLLRTEFYKLSV